MFKRWAPELGWHSTRRGVAAVGDPIGFIAAGTASATDNASMTPGLPVGRSDGDLLVLVASARGVGNLGTPVGWTPVATFVHASSGVNEFAVSFIVSAGGVGAPTVTYSGGAAGDTCIAQIYCFQNANAVPFVETGATSSNADLTNIGPITGITIAARAGVLVVGHRANDWTSVNTLAGDGLTWVECGEPDSTTGNDAGLVVDIGINETGGAVVVTDKTFIVVSGATGTGLGAMLEIAAE